MPQMTAGQAVIESLVNEGCEYVFGIVGVSNLEIVDALFDRAEVRFITTRHEQGAVDMAAGYARMTGRPGVCVATGGPGAANFVGGIFNAFRGHVPVVALSGAAGTNMVLTDSGQEMDHVSTFRSCTKLAMTMPSAERIPELMRRAFRVAMSGTRGPVFVDFPADIMLSRHVDVEFVPPDMYRPQLPAVPHEALLVSAANILKQAERPLLIVGGGVVESGASGLVVELAERLSIPMVTSSRHLDAIPGSHPLNAGPFGQWGAPETFELSSRADVILGIGTRLAGVGAYMRAGRVSKDARIMQVDTDFEALGRFCPVEVSLLGDAAEATRRIIDILRSEGAEASSAAWLAVMEEAKLKRRRRHEAEDQQRGSDVNPHAFFNEFAKHQRRDTIVVTDSGAVNTFGWERQSFEEPRTFIASPVGAIGHSIAEALGAKLARPAAPVVSISGDGGFLYNAQDLETGVREGIATVNIVLNNNLYGQEKALQRARFGDRIIGAQLTNPRFDRLAELYGAKGYYVSRLEDLGDALSAAFANVDVPSVIEVPVDPDDLPVHTLPGR